MEQKETRNRETERGDGGSPEVKGARDGGDWEEEEGRAVAPKVGGLVVFKDSSGPLNPGY